MFLLQHFGGELPGFQASTEPAFLSAAAADAGVGEDAVEGDADPVIRESFFADAFGIYETGSFEVGLAQDGVGRKVCESREDGLPLIIVPVQELNVQVLIVHLHISVGAIFVTHGLHDNSIEPTSADPGGGNGFQDRVQGRHGKTTDAEG